jgi:hypothetical protein
LFAYARLAVVIVTIIVATLAFTYATLAIVIIIVTTLAFPYTTLAIMVASNCLWKRIMPVMLILVHLKVLHPT